MHALEEKARGYFDLEGLWTVRTSQDEGVQVIFEVYGNVNIVRFIFGVKLQCRGKRGNLGNSD